MRKMSVLELLFALLLVCLLAGLGLVGALVWSLVRRAEGQAMDVAELKARLQSGGQSRRPRPPSLPDPRPPPRGWSKACGRHFARGRPSKTTRPRRLPP